jgi:hypothetical protein
MGWKQPQIVFLDHGLYVDLPEQLRQNYCALWCAFLVNDMETASIVGQTIAGDPHSPPTGGLCLGNVGEAAPYWRKEDISLWFDGGVVSGEREGKLLHIGGKRI